MSDIIIKTLKAELAEKQKRHQVLERLMNAKHLSSALAEKMDTFARRFNAATTGAEKVAIADEWKDANDEWRRSLDKAVHQNDNYQTWFNEQLNLNEEITDLKMEIATIEFRKSIGVRS